MLLEHLQIYWWLLVSVLGAVLVFLMLVQGGQTFLWGITPGTPEMARVVTALGHKWELTFTTLVVFGGAMFASFPLFYSTSFGGAYWLWMAILISFVLQAVSYEFRLRPGNLFGARTYDTFLLFNGCVGCILVGVAVSMFFFGGEFEVQRGNLLDTSAPVISVWAPTHGWEAIWNWRNLVLGVAILFLARTQAALYFQNCYKDNDAFFQRNKMRVLVNGCIFVIFFIFFMGLLLTADGLESTADGGFQVVDYKFMANYLKLWWTIPMLLIGVVMVLYAILIGGLAPHATHCIWFSGIGTVLVVLTLFWVAGYNGTPYYPSLTNIDSSLTIYNSSSSKFTLEVMSYVSILIPFVIAYIAYVWRAMGRTH